MTEYPSVMPLLKALAKLKIKVHLGDNFTGSAWNSSDEGGKVVIDDLLQAYRNEDPAPEVAARVKESFSR